MDLASAIKIVEQHGISMLKSPGAGIRGVAVGVKDRGPLRGKCDFCVTAYVDKKLTRSELQNNNLQSFSHIMQSASNDANPPLPADIDVVESGGAFRPIGRLPNQIQRGQFGGNPPVVDTQKFFNEIHPGIGITNPEATYPNNLTVGTLGFFMKDAAGSQYLVSNNHVIGESNAANLGDAIVQPGTLDLTNRELNQMNTLLKLKQKLKIASLTEIVPFQFPNHASTPHNKVDAAIARLDKTQDEADLARLAYSGSILGVADPYQVDQNGAIQGSTSVYKVGRTTGYTVGNVVGLAFSGGVSYGPNGTRTAFFTGQLAIQPTSDNGGAFSDRGDSGSAILNDGHELVGLLFAGSPSQTIANPIADVISELRRVTSNSSLDVIVK